MFHPKAAAPAFHLIVPAGSKLYHQSDDLRLSGMCSARLEASAAQQCPFLLITSSVIKSGDGNSAVLQQHLGGNRQYGILFEVCFFPVQDEYLNIYGKLPLQIFAGFCLLQKIHHPRLVNLKFQAVPQFSAVTLNTKR